MTIRMFMALSGCVLLSMGSAALADHPVAAGGASHSAPIVTISADTLPQGMLTGALQLSYAEPDTYSDAELTELAGHHVHAHTTDYNLLASASLAYGVTGHFTLSASIPFVRHDDLRAGEHSHSGGNALNTVEQLGSVSGIGDVSILGQYQFAHSHEQSWGLALLGGIKLPTGSTHVRSNEGERLETEHQPGTGSWDPLLGLAASKRWGPISLDSNVLFQFSTEGAQQTELGDRLSVNAALSYSLSGGRDHHRHANDTASHGDWTLVLEANGEWEGRQRIAGVAEAESGGKVFYISPGVRFSAPAGWSAALSAGMPVWQDVRPSHPDNDFRLIAQFGISF